MARTKRNGIAAVLRLFKPKSIPPKKGNKAYKRKLKNAKQKLHQL